MDALHIALVTETFPPEINGVAMTLWRLANGLRERGQRVSVTRPRQSEDDAEGGDDETLVTGVPIPGYAGLHFGLASRRRLSDVWRRTRPDIVHVATEGPLGWAALATARSLGIPVAASFHTNFHNYSRHYGLGWLQGPVNAYLRGFHNRAQLTLVPTHRLVEQLGADGYRNLGVMARGVDAARFHPQRRDPRLRDSWGIGETGLAVIHVGRIAPEKNLPLLVRAFRGMQESQPQARLVLVGDGPESQRMEREHPDFIFVGPRSGADLARHYASADLFVFPSLTETFGNVLLEAMASGLAVLAFDYAAAREHVQDSVNGRKAGYGDEAGFLGLARELARAPETARSLGQAARVTAEALGWEGVLDKLIEDYRQLLAARPSAAGGMPR